jgi:hypothetical protein
MFEAISNPPKNKGKEKDVGKRRAYVRVVTSLGGASLNLELFCEKVSMVGAFTGLCLTLQLQAPKTCYNFLMLAKQGKYNDVIFHRLVPGFMVSACLYCARQERLPPSQDTNWRSDRHRVRRRILLGYTVPGRVRLEGRCQT